jgi:hypothetical protein
MTLDENTDVVAHRVSILINKKALITENLKYRRQDSPKGIPSEEPAPTSGNY